MKSKIVAVICLMLAVSFIFASCSKKKYYVDDKGATYLAHTNDDGETVTDKGGHVLVVPTDSEGNIVTDEFGHYEPQTVSSEGISVDPNGKKVESSAYRLTVPRGWTVYPDIDSYTQLRPKDENSGVKVDIRYTSEKYDKTVDAIAELQKTFVQSAKETLIDTKEEVTLKDGDLPATKFTFLGVADKNGEEITSGFVYYIFSGGSHTYNVFCFVSSEDEINNMNFEEIINAMEFK